MAKQFVRSWDVFDTLIARKCIHPHGIFDLMDAVYGNNFKIARIRAENAARASMSEISLEDIYERLQVEFCWNTEERRCAIDLEIKLEFENVIPITENLSRVRNGDIVVSDMYLPHDVIKGLLNSAGLDKDVTLFVSSNGKGDGSMWRRLRSQYYILKHTGDNIRSDFLRPLLHLIPVRLTEVSQETSWEKMLRYNGAPALSAFVRQMRLKTHHADKALCIVQKAQIEANFPMLLLASAAVVKWCKESGISRALMSSRDCILWAPLAEKFACHVGSDLVVEYFLISRVAALNSSEEYLKYASNRIKTDAVVVDLSMTGVSLAGLADRLNIKEVRAFVISWCQSISASLYGNTFQPNAKVNFEYLTAEVIKEDLEAVNQALSPSIHDVCETSDGLSITYASENRACEVLEAIHVQNAAFTDMLQSIPGAVLAEAQELSGSNRLVFLIRECARHSADFKTVISRARPGSALSGDPNGIKLNLAYAAPPLSLRGLSYKLKSLVRPFIPPGSYLYRLSNRIKLILQIIGKQIK